MQRKFNKAGKAFRAASLIAGCVVATGAAVPLLGAAPAGATTPPTWNNLAVVAGSGGCTNNKAGAATSADLCAPYAVATDASGNFYIADTGSNQVDKVDASGQLTVIAGTGNGGTPTEGPATSSDLQQPQGVAFDASGNVYIADTQNWLIEEVGAPPTSLYITSTALAQPTATFGHTYSTALTSKNGVGAVHWKVTAGVLPLGVKLSSTTGVISGTPHLGKRTPSTAVYAFTVTATDSAKPTKSSWSQAYSLTVSK